MKRASWVSFLLVTVGLLTFGAFEKAHAQTCCGLSTAAAESLREMCQDGSCESPVTPGTTTVTGCQNRVLFGDSTELLQCDAGLTYTGALLESSDQTNISGPDATTNVEIGSVANDANAGTGGTCVAIGNSVNNSSNPTNCVAIGNSASVSGNSGVAIGGTATAALSGVAIGASATAGVSGIAIGAGGVSAIANQFVAGSAGTPMNNVWFGKGPASTTATAYAINGTAGSGTDNAGAGLDLAGGRGTGTARGGAVRLQTSPAIATSSTLQTLETRHIIEARQFTLADNTATTFAVQTLGNDTGGGGSISYCVYAADATTAGLECGEVDFAGIDVTAGAGGEVCPNPTKQGTPLQALSGSTLAVSFTGTTGTDLCNVRVTADTNIAVPVELWIKWGASSSGRALTPQ
jgi:trimeric autotransporter adhesin